MYYKAEFSLKKIFKSPYDPLFSVLLLPSYILWVLLDLVLSNLFFQKRLFYLQKSNFKFS